MDDWPVHPRKYFDYVCSLVLVHCEIGPLAGGKTNLPAATSTLTWQYVSWFLLQEIYKFEPGSSTPFFAVATFKCDFAKNHGHACDRHRSLLPR